MNRPWDNMTLISDPRVNRLQEPPILTLQLCPPSPYGSSGYETRVKWKGTETKEPGKERRSGG